MSAAAEAIAAFAALGVVGRGDDETVLGGAYVTLDERPGGVLIKAVRSFRPGAGAEAIRRLVEIAARFRVTLMLVPAPLDAVPDRRAAVRRLVAYYRQFGFRGGAPGMSLKPAVSKI